MYSHKYINSNIRNISDQLISVQYDQVQIYTLLNSQKILQYHSII